MRRWTMIFNFMELAIFGVLCWVVPTVAIFVALKVWNLITDYIDGTEKQIWGYKGQSKWQDMRLEVGKPPLSKTSHPGKSRRDN